MDLLFIVLTLFLVLFGFVLLFGAPYLPTHNKQMHLALDVLQLKKGAVLYELGCGDGRILKEAGRRGYRAVGYELNPLLFVIAKVNTLPYRKQVKVRLGNFWQADLSKADAVYVFLLDRFMPKLDKKLSSELKPGVKLASYTFKIPGRKITKTTSGVHVYTY